MGSNDMASLFEGLSHCSFISMMYIATLGLIVKLLDRIVIVTIPIVDRCY